MSGRGTENPAHPLFSEGLCMGMWAKFAELTIRHNKCRVKNINKFNNLFQYMSYANRPHPGLMQLPAAISSHSTRTTGNCTPIRGIQPYRNTVICLSHDGAWA